MSRKGKKVSEREQGEQTTGSVYDFLYYDSQRIGSFLAQFDPLGHLQQITEEEGAKEGRTATYKGALTGSASVDVPFTQSGLKAQGEGSITEARSREGNENSARVYDPLWTNALSFIDMIDERRLLQRDHRRARIGQLVLASGALEVLDISIVKSLLVVPTIKNLVDKLNANMPEEERKEFEISVETVSQFPHTVQAHLTSGSTRLWSTLKPVCFVSQPDDLLLKHGTKLSGIWNIIGILDAFSKEQPDTAPERLEGNDIIMNSNLFTQLLTNLAPMVRAFLGRPVGSFGMTPLLIFREVGGQV